MRKSSRLASVFLCIAMVLSVVLVVSIRNVSAMAYSGVITLTEKELYDETNTYNVNSSCFDKNTGEFITTWIDSKKTNKTQYNISYDMSTKQNRSVMNKAQITVLTPGLASNAGTWSNNFSSANKDNAFFAYDSSSLITKISDQVGGANIYWTKMVAYNNFYLYNITNQTSVYVNDSIYEIQNITDISRHIIVVFDPYRDSKIKLDSSYDTNNNVYYQFNYMLSKIIYDVKIANGGILPKVNLIGHSRGGLTNLQYALDHPDLVSTLVSLDTPYFGSTTARLFGEIVMGGPSDGLDDILDADLYYGYNKRWNENYNALYKDIDVYAFGSYHTLMSLAEVITSDCSESIPVWGQLLIGLGLDALNVWKLHSISSYITERVILAIITEMLDIIFPNSKLVDAAEILFQEINYDVYPLFVSWYNDILVNLDSQLGNDTGSIKHPYSGSYSGFKRMVRPFQVFDEYVNYEKVSQASIPVGHNLVARDKLIVAKVVSVLDLGVDTNYVTIENDDNTLTFVRYNGEYSGSTFYVPETIGGKTVTEIAAYAFDGETNITEIVLPKTIKKISAYAFAGLENLTTITFAGTGQPQLEKIGYGAFSGCTNLKKFNSSAAETLNRSDLNMPDSVEFIDCYAFYGTGFTDIFLGANIYYIGDVAFSNIAGLTNISVTGNSTYFSSNGALYNSDGWLMQYPVGKDDTSFTIPSSVSNVAIRHISQFAFMGENNLDTINLGNVITIDSYAFMGCTKLSEFYNASDIKYVGPFALDDTRIMLETQDFITLGEVLYKYKGTANVLEASDFPSGVTRIASNAFCCNDNIEKIYLPNKKIDIDNNAFVDCANLEEIIYYNGELPDVGKFSFLALPDTFKFKCRKRLIDSVTSSNNWYSQRDVMSAISTEVYFEDINKTATFYWGETVELPTETISGKYIKGWLRVDESTGQTCGNYLSSSSVWNETVSHATYRADTETLESYTLQFFNGDVQIGSFNISIGDEFSITQTGYVLNGTSYTFANYEAMVNCVGEGYYGASVVNGQVIAIFKGWFLNGELISDGRWINSYSDNALCVKAKWEPIEFTATVYNGYSSTYTKQFNYFEELILDNPVRSGYMFKGWRNNGTGAIVDMPLIIAGNVSLTAQWVKIYTITYANLTFMGQTARVYWNNYSSYAPTYYERGVGLDLTNVNALWTGYNTHSLCLVFLGWYTDMNFKTQVTSISTSATGNRTYYAKWRYDYEATGFWAESGTLITDAGQFNNPYNSILLGLSTTDGFYENLLSIGIKYLVLNYEIKMHEIDDGYQRIYVYDGPGKDATQLYYNQFEYYSPGKKISSGIVQRRIVIPISSLQNINYLYIRYDGSGWGKDDWVIERIYCEVMYINSIEDINGPGFSWRNDYPFSDDNIEVGWDD